MRRLIRSRLIWIYTVCKCVSKFTWCPNLPYFTLVVSLYFKCTWTYNCFCCACFITSVFLPIEEGSFNNMDSWCGWKNSVDPNQLASEEASWSGSTLFSKKVIAFWKSKAHITLMRLNTLVTFWHEKPQACPVIRNIFHFVESWPICVECFASFICWGFS